MNTGADPAPTARTIPIVRRFILCSIHGFAMTLFGVFATGVFLGILIGARGSARVQDTTRDVTYALVVASPIYLFLCAATTLAAALIIRQGRWFLRSFLFALPFGLLALAIAGSPGVLRPHASWIFLEPDPAGLDVVRAGGNFEAVKARIEERLVETLGERSAARLSVTEVSPASRSSIEVSVVLVEEAGAIIAIGWTRDHHLPDLPMTGPGRASGKRLSQLLEGKPDLRRRDLFIVERR